MRTFIRKVAEVGYRATELLSALVAILITTAFVDDILICFKMGVNLCKEVLWKIELRKNRVLINLEAIKD